MLKHLGRGAAGHVFLASQPSLGDRPVVVKLTTFHGQEHLTLARLQHTNIVPLYAVVDDPVRKLRILCMPYFGGVTLDVLLDKLADLPPRDRNLPHVIANLRTASALATGPAIKILEQLSFEKSICWICLNLAEALHYAHECGLVHFDLKPSNVLIAADGQPMLLDFHLARPPIRTQGPLPDHLGGTPGYMPPEQEKALAALVAGTKIAVPVDRRVDIYALGALLYQTFGGRLPAQSGAPTPLWKCNPRISKGLSAIVEKCLAPSAAALSGRPGAGQRSPPAYPRSAACGRRQSRLGGALS